MKYKTIVYASIGLLIAVFPLTALSQTLVYEREYTSFQSVDNILRITLDQQGVVTIDRPSFMTHSGRHTFQVSPRRYAELSAQLTDLPFTSEELNASVRQRVGQEMFHVSHSEYTRFQLQDGARNISDAVEIVSLRAYSNRFEDHSNLSVARALEKQWLSMMDDLMQAQIQKAQIQGEAR